MVKLVAFDMDGTVGDTLPLCIGAFREAVERAVGHSVTDEQIRQTFGSNDEGMIRQIVARGWRQALDDFYVAYIRLHGMCPQPFGGVRELLMGLREAGVLTALVTGKGPVTCAVTLDRFGLNECFDAVETGTVEKFGKHLALGALLRKFALRADEVLYVGDTASDVEACRCVGVRCLSAAWAPSADRAELERVNATDVWDSIERLDEALRAMCRKHDV